MADSICAPAFLVLIWWWAQVLGNDQLICSAVISSCFQCDKGWENMISIPEQFPGIILGESVGISCMLLFIITEIITSGNYYNA